MADQLRAATITIHSEPLRRSRPGAPHQCGHELALLTRACENPAPVTFCLDEKNMFKKLMAEFIGTAWLVLGGGGAAVLAAGYPQLRIGFVGVALAFGLTVLTMAYAVGHVSGCHLNPAVSVGLWAGGRFPAKDLIPYVIAQVLGAVVGAAILYEIASGRPGFDVAAGFASNGYGAHSPGGYSLGACLVAEIAMTFGFLFVIMGATHGSAPKGFAPI